MNTSYHNDQSGVKLLVKKYREQFRIEENLNHYSKENYKIAERKFLKYALSMGDFRPATN
jgi:hypothetical protein